MEGTAPASAGHTSFCGFARSEKKGFVRTKTISRGACDIPCGWRGLQAVAFGEGARRSEAVRLAPGRTKPWMLGPALVPFFTWLCDFGHVTAHLGASVSMAKNDGLESMVPVTPLGSASLLSPHLLRCLHCELSLGGRCFPALLLPAQPGEPREGVFT